jgi:hypothetical protein
VGCGTLLAVDAKPLLGFQERREWDANRWPACLRPHINVAVIGIAAELVSASLQFPVEIVQQQIRQQWRERAALGRSLASRHAYAIVHQPRFEKAADDSQQAFVANAAGKSRHQDVVIHSIEELR